MPDSTDAASDTEDALAAIMRLTDSPTPGEAVRRIRELRDAFRREVAVNRMAGGDAAADIAAWDATDAALRAAFGAGGPRRGRGRSRCA